MNRSIIVLLGVLAVLVLAYIIINTARDVTEKPELFFTLDTTRVDGLTIINNHDTINLKKRADGWYLGEPLDYPADARFTSNVMEKLGTMQIETLITEDTTKAAQYEVDTAGVEVEVFQGEESVAHFIIGKTSPSNRHTYCSFVDDDKIYLLQGTFTSQLNRKKKDWRDKVILEIDKVLINRLDFTYPQESFSVIRSDTGWTVEGQGASFVADENLVNRSLQTVSRFRTFDFVDGDTVQVVDYTVPSLILTVNTDIGDTYQFSFVPQDDEAKRYLVKKDGVERTLFVIHQGSANAIMKHPDDFQIKEEEGA
jgi:hypothetical protein